MKKATLIFWLIIILSLGISGLTACASGDDDDDEAADADDDGDDDSDDDDGADNSCGINYSADTGRDGSADECGNVDMINVDRLAHPDESDCAPAIQWHAGLAAVALAHSKDMCDRDFFDHVNLDGDSPFDRMDDAGVNYVAAGENIAWGMGYTVQNLQDAFMNEPECELNHRSNILARDFTHVGVGIYDCPDGSFYLTQDFGTFSFDDIRSDSHDYCPNFEQ